jgi:phosphoribosylanthranilate isomerase
MGFIFWEKSSRYFDGMIPELKTLIKTGVFVDESIAIIIEKSQK